MGRGLRHGRGSRARGSRVEAGALLYTSAPFGLFLATFVNAEVAGEWFAHDPAMSWRYVLLFGLLPAGVAFVVRMFIHEPERWAALPRTPRPRECARSSRPECARARVSALIVTFVALITWWTCNAFIQALANSARGRRGRHARPRRHRHRRAQAELDQDRHLLLQLGRPARHAAHDSARQDPRPPHHVRDLLRLLARSRCSPPSGSTCRRKRGSTCSSSSASRCSASSAASRSIYPSCSRRACAPPAAASATTSAAWSRRAACSRSAPSRRSAKGDPADHRAHAVHDRLRAAHRACAAALGHRDARPEDARLTHG